MTKAIIAGALIVLIGVPAYIFFSVSSSSVIQPPPQVLGRTASVPVQVANPNGIRSLTLTLRQGKAVSEAGARWDSARWFLSQKHLPPQTANVQLKAAPESGFRTGPAKLAVTAVSNDLRGKTDVQEFDVAISLEPPRVQADGVQHYINQGGAELVTFAVSGAWTEAGVKVGGYRFRSYPVPGAKSPNERFCMFAFPWDVPATEVPEVYAKDAAGQEATGRFWFKVFPKNWRKRELELNDAFLDKVASELNPGSGTTLDRFLEVNRDMRQQNNAALAALRNQTEQKFLWVSPFEQLSNSQVEAQFADFRTYIYNGKKVDEQVHLGFDLSKTAQSPVVAANSGRVVFAGPLGIYGNCVVIDHGYTLQSIYAHMSSISVKAGDRVERRQEIGRSGATGLAGGDHLHYSMQLDGVQVNPVEWWDAHWIQDRIASKLPPGSIAAVKP